MERKQTKNGSWMVLNKNAYMERGTSPTVPNIYRPTDDVAPVE